MSWIVQANMRDQALRADAVAALARLGEDVHELAVGTELPPLPFAASARRVVCFGASFVPRVATETAWTPGIYFAPALFQWSVMAAHWRELMFTTDGVVTPLRDALAQLEAAPRFVRPDADSKLFDGGRYDRADDLRAVVGGVELDVAVVCGTPRPVDAEWRCYVVGAEVVDASEYRRAGRPSLHRGAPPRAISLVEEAAARWSPAAVTCIDVASSGHHFGILEANCFSAARPYAVDLEAVFAAVSAWARASPC